MKNLKYQDKFIEKIKIGPELAEFMLNQKMQNQRKIDLKTVNKYARDMKNGYWIELLGDPIRFGKNGRLVDGQHRLKALIIANVELYFYVAYGLEEGDFMIIDKGKKRRIGDDFHILGIKNSNAMAAAISLLWRYDNKLMDSDGSIICNSTEAYEYYSKNENIQLSFRPAQKMKGYLTISLGIFLHYIFSRIDIIQADSFFDHLLTGANLQINDPVLSLRNKYAFYKKPTVNIRLSRKTILAITIIAWNYKRENKKIKTNNLRWKTKTFPEAI